VVAALITTLIVAAGAALDWGSEDSFQQGGVSESNLRHAAAQYADAEGRSQGVIDANADLKRLLPDGSYEEGRDLGYDYSWNTAVRGALDQVPSQWLADEPGTQWVELFR
jgi:hypothetical protein